MKQQSRCTEDVASISYLHGSQPKDDKYLVQGTRNGTGRKQVKGVTKTGFPHHFLFCNIRKIWYGSVFMNQTAVTFLEMGFGWGLTKVLNNVNSTHTNKEHKVRFLQGV